MFRKNISPPSSRLKNKPRKKQAVPGNECLPPISCLVYSLALKIAVVFLRNVGLSELYGFTTQKTAFFIIITMTTLNPKWRFACTVVTSS
jgi:hypothetical protein